MIYSSAENKKVKEYKKLKQKKYRDKTKMFLVEGQHLVEEAYKNGQLQELLLEEETNYNLDIKTIYLTKPIMKSISSLTTPPKIMGLCKKKCSENLGEKIILLDDIQDPGNLGTIIRSAVAFDFNTIIISKNTVDPYNEKVIRATQGMIFKVNILITNIDEIIPKLKNQEYKILGTKVTFGKNIKSLEKNKKVAIIMGNEGSGVKPNLLKKCDEHIYIPMNKNCESLNVGVATSIIMYELR